MTLENRMRIAKDQIARGVKNGEHPYVTEYFDRIAEAKEKAKTEEKPRGRRK